MVTGYRLRPRTTSPGAARNGRSGRSATLALTSCAAWRPSMSWRRAKPATHVADSHIPTVRRLNGASVLFMGPLSRRKAGEPAGTRDAPVARSFERLAGRAGIGCARHLSADQGPRRRAALLQAGVACCQHRLGGDQRVDRHSGTQARTASPRACNADAKASRSSASAADCSWLSRMFTSSRCSRQNRPGPRRGWARS